MAAPGLITKTEWIKQTKRRAHSRSDALKTVDDYIDAYDHNKTPGNLENLRVFLDLWVNPKYKSHWYRSEVKLETIRDHLGAVTSLLRACEQALALRSPIASDYGGIFIGNDQYRGNHWVVDGFVGTVRDALREIARGPNGRQLLADLTAAHNRDPGKKIVIEYCGDIGKSCAAPIEVMTNENRRLVQATNSLVARNYPNPQASLQNPRLMAIETGVTEDNRQRTYVGGAGTGAVVVWASQDPGPPWVGGHRPGFIALAHELVHAHHYLRGSCYRAATGFVEDNGNTGIMEEEMRTVGCQRFVGEVPSENAVRADHHIAARTSYDPRLCWDHVVASPFL